MISDLRFALRQFGRSPGFFTLAILTLGLGIGSCAAIFSVVNGVLLRPLIYPHAEQVMMLKEADLPTFPEFSVSPPNFHDWETQLHSFAALAAIRGNAFNLTGDGEPQRLFGVKVTSRYFEVCGFQPALGRAFLPEEDTPGRNQEVILSDACWQRIAGGKPDIIGRNLQLNGLPYLVIGVMPPGFGQGEGVDVWSPMAFAATDLANDNRDDHFLQVTGRLRPGVTPEQADAELKLVAAGIAAKYPDTSKGWSAFTVPLLEYITRDVRVVLYTLLGAVGCVLLIACANVANLLLARANARQRELLIRSAVGAGRGRLVRQLLTESVLLACVGGAAGLGLAWVGVPALLALAPAGLPRASDVHLDGRVLAAALALSVITGLAFGLAPAWLASRTELNSGIKRGSRGRLRGSLVVAEIAASLVLLAAAALLVRSFGKLTHVDPGFRPENAVVVRLTLPDKGYAHPAQQLAFADALQSRLASLPGVQAVGLSQSIPILNDWVWAFQIEGEPPRPPSQQPSLNYFAVSPGYFPAMGIRLLRGRLLDPHDNAQAPKVIVVNETFVQQHFPHEDPLGHRVSFGGGADDWHEIVGVVADVTQHGVDQVTPAQGYGAFAQGPFKTLNVVVRTRGPLTPVLGLLRPAVYATDPNQPVGSITPLASILADSLARQRFSALLLTLFSFVALVLAAIGIYGVMAYSVTQRTGEIGIRLALGAPTRSIFGLILGDGARLIGLGTVCGIAATLLCGRILAASLYRTNAHDPATLAAIVGFFALIALAACSLPARRAARLDPLKAIRTE